MNAYNISLSSSTTNTVTYLNTVYLTDVTNLTIDLLGVYDKILTSRILIDWGDGSPIETYDRSFLRTIKQIQYYQRYCMGKRVYC